MKKIGSEYAVRILMVDDDAVIRRGICQMLTDSLEWEFHWSEADNGREALEMIGDTFTDIVICDIKMPLIDGIGFLSYQKEISPCTRVIMLSGFDDYSLIRQAMKMGAFDYLLKPVNLFSLLQILNEIYEEIQGSCEERRIYPLAQSSLNSMGENSLEKPEEIFFDLKNNLPATVQELDRYLSEAGTKAALLQTEEAVFFLHQFFGHLTPETLTPEQIRRKLSDWVYALMQANNKFIEPISQDRLTENDLFSHIRNLPTLQQLSQQFTQIIELYLRYLSSNVVSKNAFLIKKALAYIDAHYRENPSLEEVASSLFISASYFSALFSKTMGESFRTYLLKLKMEEAKRLLSQSDIKILDIAYQMGYEDLSHFNRAFKKVIGCSPSHFRKISQG